MVRLWADKKTSAILALVVFRSERTASSRVLFPNNRVGGEVEVVRPSASAARINQVSSDGAVAICHGPRGGRPRRFYWLQGPGPDVKSKKPDTVPLKCEEVVEPVLVFTTTTKLDCAGTVKE
jgi:hypothetical protein